MNISDSLINRIIEISEENIPENIIHTIKRCIIDYLGVVFAGSKKSEDNDYSILKIGNAPIIGTGTKSNALYASLLNGFNAHILELDDGHRYGMVHVGSIILSSVFSVASEENITNPDRIMRAVLAGYETTIALARSLQPEHKLKGFHTSGTCGTIGAAMAVGVLLGFDKAELKKTLAMAVSSAAGLLILMDDDSELKPYNIGRAAMDGVASTIMGKSKWNPPLDPLGGERGFADVMAGRNISEECLWNRNEYYISGIYTKAYASCRHCHPSVEAALKIRSIYGLNEENADSEIEKISIRTYQLAIKGHDHSVISSEQSAKMSIPYSVSVALCYGEFGCDAFSKDRIQDKYIHDLMPKVFVEEYIPYTEECPQKRIAELVVFFSDGRNVVEKIEYPLGEPENPMSDEQIENKTLGLLTDAGLNDECARNIIDSVWMMDKKKVFNVWEMF